MKKDKLPKLVNEWLIKGENDLKTAEILLKENGPTDTLCFHCHQAVEKFIKAYLVFHNAPFVKIHNLWNLAKLAGKKDKSILKFKKELKNLDAYYIESRYPSEVSFYTIKECKEVFDNAGKITQFLINLML